MSSVDLNALEAKVEALRAVRVFSPEVAAGAEEVLAALPAPDAERVQERRMRVLLLRARAALLLPRVSAEAEADVNAALKLGCSNVPAVWLDLYECLLRRNALREACAALDSALAADPGCVDALCRYSQALRNRCAEPGLSVEEKRALMSEATAKARAATAADPTSAEAWHTLSLSLLAETTFAGMELPALRRCLAAMRQAERLTAAAEDPDVFYNKGAIESAMGRYGDATADFVHAHALDKTRLGGVQRACESAVHPLRTADTRMRSLRGIGKHELKRLQKSVATGAAPGTALLAVADIVTEPAEQPLALLTCDAAGEFALVLLYGITASTFKIGDRLAFPAAGATVTETVTHTVPVVPFADVAGDFTLTLRQHYPSASEVSLNGRPIPARARVAAHISSRLFS